MTQSTLILGAVAYDPKVVTIWEGFKAWLATRGLPFDFVLYSNYESQVEAHLAGRVDLAWNSPLAWLETERLAGSRASAVLMRDTDCDLTSVILARADSAIKTPSDLEGKKVGTGAHDSPQATLLPLLPLLHLAELGVDTQPVAHDVLVGKHGDHVGGERDAVRALLAGKVDAACVIDGNHLAFSREGTLPAGSVRVIAQTDKYDHCNFTALEKSPLIDRFVKLLLEMSYDDPVARPLLDLEGLKAWRRGRVEGYAALSRAIDRFGTITPWLERNRK